MGWSWWAVHQTGPPPAPARNVVTTHSPGNTKAGDWLQTMNNMGYGFKGVYAMSPISTPAKDMRRKVTAEVRRGGRTGRQCRYYPR